MTFPRGQISEGPSRAPWTVTEPAVTRSHTGLALAHWPASTSTPSESRAEPREVQCISKVTQGAGAQPGAEVFCSGQRLRTARSQRQRWWLASFFLLTVCAMRVWGHSPFDRRMVNTSFVWLGHTFPLGRVASGVSELLAWSLSGARLGRRPIWNSPRRGSGGQTQQRLLGTGLQS